MRPSEALSGCGHVGVFDAIVAMATFPCYIFAISALFTNDCSVVRVSSVGSIYDKTNVVGHTTNPSPQARTNTYDPSVGVRDSDRDRKRGRGRGRWTRRSSDWAAVDAAFSLLADASGRARSLVDELLAGPISSTAFIFPNASAMLWRMRVRSEAVARALNEVDHLFVNLAKQGPLEDELSLARARRGAGLASSFATTSGAAEQYAFMWRMGEPVDDVATMNARYTTLDVGTVKAASARWLDARKMRVVLVADWEAVREPLAALRWGPLEVHGRDGKIRIEGATHANH